MLFVKKSSGLYLKARKLIETDGGLPQMTNSIKLISYNLIETILQNVFGVFVFMDKLRKNEWPIL